MYDTIFAEAQNRPAALLIYKYFVNDAQSAASSRGLPGVRLVPESIVSECSVNEEIEAGVDSILDDLIGALTRPLTGEEKVPKLREQARPGIVFKGTVGEVNRFFYQRGWTDGLPILPPTEEAVAEMLTGTDLPRDHVIAELEPRRGKATIECVAINAVMAGALPTYMPVLIAGVKTLATNPMADVWAVSTGSWAPLWIINGPVRNDLRINNSYGVMSPGEMANAAIGRALALITRNIRGVRRHIEDMGVLGNPAKYSSVVAENEEESPWEPLHVERGLKREDSAITVWFPHCYQQLSSYGTDDKGILATITCNIAPGRFGQLGVMMTPVNAQALAKRGWSKANMKKHIVDNAEVPWRCHPRSYSEASPSHQPEEVVPIFPANPNQPPPIQVFVAGGQGSWTGLFSGGGTLTTTRVELPPNWEKLVARYKNIAPTYVRY
ncbi:MAG: hypothetical protein A2147_05345 [Chloroflexi bacterium RBG_16_57_8]|nr:MAG: hypothetical protein A2147_05345 [Chloroflexi bacterium RBG_16_57_8]